MFRTQNPSYLMNKYLNIYLIPYFIYPSSQNYEFFARVSRCFSYAAPVLHDTGCARHSHATMGT